ncbi:MAG: peptidoglycan-binding domain-containing protein [Candidatus Omnitrophota bacterium]
MKGDFLYGAFTAIGVFLISGCGQQAQKPADTVIPHQEGAFSNTTTDSTSAQHKDLVIETQPIQVPAAPLGGLEVKPRVEYAGAEDLGDLFVKPTEKEIQQALKNAGLYDGEVDGKIGPRSKRAIEEFQAQNNLKADGKVGAKTWQKLKEHLNAEPSPSD